MLSGENLGLILLLVFVVHERDLRREGLLVTSRILKEGLLFLGDSEVFIKDAQLYDPIITGLACCSVGGPEEGELANSLLAVSENLGLSGVAVREPPWNGATIRLNRPPTLGGSPQCLNLRGGSRTRELPA